MPALPFRSIRLQLRRSFHFQPDPIVDRQGEVLLGAQVALGGLCRFSLISTTGTLILMNLIYSLISTIVPTLIQLFLN